MTCLQARAQAQEGCHLIVVELKLLQLFAEGRPVQHSTTVTELMDLISLPFLVLQLVSTAAVGRVT